MKFGKELLRAVSASTQVVSADKWIDYKVLKKILKSMPERFEEGSDVGRIVESSAEREFFRALHNELAKVNARFSEMWEVVLERVSMWDGSDKEDAMNQESITRSLQSCIKDHMFALLVENYAVLNYCGFTKILKKHDKLRATSTRDRYMVRMVNEKPFSKFDMMHEVLCKIEHRFNTLTALAELANKAAAGNGRPAPTASPHASLVKRKKELESINVQGMDRLKSLAETVSLLEAQESASTSSSSSEALGATANAAAASLAQATPIVVAADTDATDSARKRRKVSPR